MVAITEQLLTNSVNEPLLGLTEIPELEIPTACRNSVVLHCAHCLPTSISSFIYVEGQFGVEGDSRAVVGLCPSHVVPLLGLMPPPVVGLFFLCRLPSS